MLLQVVRVIPQRRLPVAMLAGTLDKRNEIPILKISLCASALMQLLLLTLRVLAPFASLR
jgi:hypothetical protein